MTSITWDSLDGLKTVLQPREGGGFWVKSDTYRLGYHVADLDDERRRDAIRLQEHGERLRRDAAEADAAAILKADRESLDGYGANLPPMARGRAANCLARLVQCSYGVMSRRDLIRRAISEGARVTPHERDGRPVLQRPDGVFWDSDALTKTALDYAAHLCANLET